MERNERNIRRSFNNLQKLFHQRDKLARELNRIDGLIALDGREYWKLKGYTVMPRAERLRDEILGETK